MNSSNKEEIEELLQNEIFDVIDLNTINATSKLLNRDERKYILHRSNLSEVILSLAPRFAILEHVGKRKFRYDSVYFDDNFLTYYMHHQGKRKRFKIRSRMYADSGLCLFEMKVKTLRGRTDKRNMGYDKESRFEINNEAKKFCDEIFKECYGERFQRNFEFSLRVINDRITFVAKDGGERITIDMNLVFESNKGKFITPNDFVIIETKTKNGKGFCDRLLRSYGLRPQRKCSKYCIGVAENGLVTKKNIFLDVIRKIESMGPGVFLPSTNIHTSIIDPIQEKTEHAIN